MNKALKVSLLVGVPIVVGISTLFIFRAISKNKKEEDGNVYEKSGSTPVPPTAPPKPKTEEFLMGYHREKPFDDHNLVVTFNPPRPPMGTIEAGDKIGLRKAGKLSGDYTVRKVWKDKNGTLGAMYLNNPRISREVTLSREFQGKGKIIKYL